MRKSQVTIYVIIGLIALVSLGVFLGLQNRVFTGVMQGTQLTSPIYTQGALDTIIDNCLNSIIIKSLDDYGMCDTEEDFEKKIHNELPDCINFSRFQGYKLNTKSYPELVLVDFSDKGIRVNLSFPIELEKEGATLRFDSRIIDFNLDRTISLNSDKENILVAPNNRMELIIPKGTKASSGSGPINTLKVTIEPQCPYDSSSLGKFNYVFEPERVFFEPEAFLTLRFVEEDVSANAEPLKFKISMLDDNHWSVIESSSNIQSNRIRASVSNLTKSTPSCIGANKHGMQILVESILGFECPEQTHPLLRSGIDCAASFAGPCGYLKFILLTQSGKDYADEFYLKVVNETYMAELTPLLNLKEVPPSTTMPIWFHPGSCNGVPSICKDSYSSGSNPKCSSYSLDCYYGEDEDGNNKPVYDYSYSKQRAREMIDYIHRKKPEWPLMIEIWNEPNLAYEWHNLSLTDYEIEQFARFFVEIAEEIKSLPHSKSIKIITPGLAPTTGERVCEIKPSQAKRYHEFTPDHRVMGSGTWYFTKQDCSLLGNMNNYISGESNYCTGTGLPEQGIENCVLCSTPGQENCLPQDEYRDCVCRNKNQLINGIRDSISKYPSHVFTDIDTGKLVSCTRDNYLSNEAVDVAEQIKKRIIETYGTYCFEKITAVDTNEYLRKMLGSEYGKRMCEVMDIYGDHSYPSIESLDSYPGGEPPYGMITYKERFEIVKSLCDEITRECINPSEHDSDGDGIVDINDNCPYTYNSGQEDWDKEGIGDMCDDSDGDGIVDAEDLCPLDPEISILEHIRRITGNPNLKLEEADSDGDGRAELCDNCPNIYNPGQEDLNLDAIGDACEYDLDDDGVTNFGFDRQCSVNEVNNIITECNDNCPYAHNPKQTDSDDDGVGDACDNCPYAYNPGQEDWNNNGRGDVCEDTDGDSFMDDIDHCPGVSSEENTLEMCIPLELCPGKVFITETAWAPPPKTRAFNVDDYASLMEKAFRYWEDDEDILGAVPFHLGDNRISSEEWLPYSWTSNVCEDACVGKTIFNIVGRVQEPVKNCIESEFSCSKDTS